MMEEEDEDGVCVGRSRWQHLLLVGCSHSDTGDGQSNGGVKTYAQATQEYRAAQSKLTLPPGVGPDGWGAKLLETSDGAPVMYQPGAATGTVQGGWLCSWQKEWLAERGIDASREATAMQQMKHFFDMETYRQYFDASARDFFKKEMAAAELGDPSMVQVDVKNNCG